MDIETETARVRSFVDRGNFHAALNIALSAMNAARREDDQQATNHFLDLMADIITTMRQQFGSQ